MSRFIKNNSRVYMSKGFLRTSGVYTFKTKVVDPHYGTSKIFHKVNSFQNILKIILKSLPTFQIRLKRFMPISSGKTIINTQNCF